MDDQFVIDFDSSPEELDEDALLADIENKVVEDLKLGFDPGVLEVLDDPNSSSRQIEDLKNLISPDIVARMFSMSNSTYIGSLRSGDVSTFYDIVIRLGMSQSKVVTLALSLFSITQDRELKEMSARAFATMLMARQLSTEMGYRRDVSEKAELCGLLYEIGRIVMFLYKKYHGGESIDEGFVERNHHRMGIKIIEKFKLPEFMKEIMDTRHFRFEDDSMHLASVVMLAHSVVDNSFKTSGKFVIQSPMPVEGGARSVTVGSMFREQFDAMGLGEYLEVIEVETESKKSMSA